MKKNTIKKLSFFAVFSSLLALSSCTIVTVTPGPGVNTSTNNGGGTVQPSSNNPVSEIPVSVEVPVGELDLILQKYDDLGYEYIFDDNRDVVNISMAHWDSSGAVVERQVVTNLIKGFNKRYPTINVDLEIIQSYEDTYGNKLSAGTAHDVFLTPDGAIPGWASSGKLENLTPYINTSDILTPEDMNDIYPSCLTRYQYNPSTGRMGSGNQLALPKDVGPYVMYYNKTWFEEKGVALPPNDRIMTMDEALTMWKALTKKDSSGNISGYGVAGLPIEGLVWSAGGDFLNSNRDGFPTDSKTLAGLKKGYQFMQDSYVKDFIQPPASFVGTMDPTALFQQQAVACVISGRWDVTAFRQLQFDWDVAFVPAFTENPTKNMYSGSVGYAVNSQSKEKLAAWKLVEYIASKEGQEILSATGFQIPVYESLALEEDLVASEKEKGPMNYEIFVESAKNQGYGLWQYRSNTMWKIKGYDLPSENLYAEKANSRITVDEFLAEAKPLVDQYCRV